MLQVVAAVGISNCGARRRDANNRVTVPEAGSAMSVKVRDDLRPLKAMEAAGDLGAGLLSLRGMISLRPEGISQLNPDSVLESMNAYRYRAPKKPR